MGIIDVGVKKSVRKSCAIRAKLTKSCNGALHLYAFRTSFIPLCTPFDAVSSRLTMV